MNREHIVAEMNQAAARVAELRSAESVDVDALSGAVIALDACRSELAAFDAKQTVIAATETKTEEVSFGRAAAEKLASAPIGSKTSVERSIIADPWGSVSGRDDVTFPQVVGYVTNPDQPTAFLDTLAVAPATSDVVTYVSETGFTNAAAARLAGASTAESDLTFSKVALPVANVAHYIRIAEETLADAPALSQLIDRRGVSGVRRKMNEGLLNVSDQSNSVKSVVAAATELEYSGSLIDGILSAKTDIEELGFTATTVVMSPATFEAVATSREGSGTGAYLAGGPFGASTRTIWGLNIVVDAQLDGAVDALVYDASGATLYVRDAADVATDRDLSTNLVTVRVQTRAQVAVTQPEAFIKLVPAA